MQYRATRQVLSLTSVHMSLLIHVVISMCCSKKRWKNDTTIHFRSSCFAKSIWSTKKGWTQFSSWEFYCRIGHFSFIFLLVSRSLWVLLLFICGSKLSVFSFLLNTWQCCFVFVFRYWCYCCSTNDLASVVLALSCCLKEASHCCFAQSNLAETGIPPRAHLCCRFHSSNYFRLDFFLSLPY